MPISESSISDSFFFFAYLKIFPKEKKCYTNIKNSQHISFKSFCLFYFKSWGGGKFLVRPNNEHFGSKSKKFRVEISNNSEDFRVKISMILGLKSQWFWGLKSRWYWVEISMILVHENSIYLAHEISMIWRMILVQNLIDFMSVS